MSYKETDKSRAKEIFFSYCCNWFFLSRDEHLDEYSSYNVSKEEENIWRREYIEKNLRELSPKNYKPLQCLVLSHAGEALSAVLEKAEKVEESFIKLQFANAIWELAANAIVSEILRQKAAVKAVDMWFELIKEPLKISEKSQKAIAPSLEYLKLSTPEKYIRNYALGNLKNNKLLKEDPPILNLNSD